MISWNDQIALGGEIGGEHQRIKQAALIIVAAPIDAPK
jgi:hypothetical protein